MIKLVLLSSLILFNTSQAMLFKIIDSSRSLDEKIQMVQGLFPEEKIYINQPNEKGDTPLLHLCKKEFHDKEDQTKLARSLIENGADINAQTKNGNTPLHLAVIKSNASLVKLINDKRPLYKSNNNNLNAFELAYRLGKFEMGKIMAPGVGEWCSNQQDN